LSKSVRGQAQLAEDEAQVSLAKPRDAYVHLIKARIEEQRIVGAFLEADNDYLFRNGDGSCGIDEIVEEMARGGCLITIPILHPRRRYKLLAMTVRIRSHCTFIGTG